MNKGQNITLHVFTGEKKDSIQYVTNKINTSIMLITDDITLIHYCNPKVIIFNFNYIQYM